MNDPIENILYATDLGPHGPEVFRYAIAMSRAFRAKIHVVHVLEPLSDFAESLLSTYMSEEVQAKVAEEGFADARQELEKRADKICREDSGLTREELEEMVGEVKVLEGVPFRVILDTAEQVSADMIIMGSREQGVLDEMLLGSVAHKVLTRSDVPVLLVPIQSD